MYYLLVVLATFWCWETLRYAAEQFVPAVFAATRAVHPLLVASLPVLLLWPDWVAGLALAGATGLLVAVVDRFLAGSSSPTPVVLPRRRTGGLPPLP